jgi:hypothetical protein
MRQLFSDIRYQFGRKFVRKVSDCEDVQRS